MRPDKQARLPSAYVGGCQEVRRRFRPSQPTVKAATFMDAKTHARYWAMYDLAFGYHDRHAAFHQMVAAGIHWREAAQEIRDFEHGGEHGP